MIRRSVLLTVVAGSIAVGALPSLAASPAPTTTPPPPPLQPRYACVVLDTQPAKGVCVWAPLPV